MPETVSEKFGYADDWAAGNRGCYGGRHKRNEGVTWHLVFGNESNKDCNNSILS